MSPPGPSPADIQSHLYAAFLEGSTADVALRVSGSWCAVYRLHRVVLIQSGFFRSLFTPGWAESSPRRGVHRRTPDEIDIIFDDANITRPAFEVCVARLYGGGPPLHVSPAIIPTTTQPLTPSFPLPRHPLPIPPGHHPASPRFLLSLLATAVYLSIPYVASQALSAILSTVGPHTVVLYHNFALGKPIGPSPPFSLEPEAAVGLEHVAQPMDDDDVSMHSRAGSLQTTKNKGKDRERNDSPTATSNLDLKTDSFSPSSGDYSSDEDELRPNEVYFHYGAISDKIGEATSCWLARWAVDMLAYEEEKVLGRDISPLASGRRRAMTISTTPTPSMTSKEPVIPTIWARGGLNAKWVAAIASADTLFIRGERERYDFARSVVELRRRDGVLQEEEQEWTRLFDEGIYYSNMSPQDIMIISQDISPITKRPFVQISTLQTAHWNQSLLRHHIMFRPASGSGLSPPSLLPSSPARDRELGLATSTTDLAARFSQLAEDEKRIEEAKRYYQIPGDSSLRIGDNGATTDGVPTNMEQLFTTSHTPGSIPNNPTPGRSRPLTSEENFFGLFTSRSRASNCVSPPSIIANSGSLGMVNNQSWSPYPPFRFSVEFWDLDALREKNRLYSHTIWYAGSLYNIYVQIVRKKAQAQLGIYVHRQSNVDPIPPPSAPSILALKGEKDRRKEWEWERDKEEKETERRERERGMSLSGTATSPTKSGGPTHHRGPSLPIPLINGSSSRIPPSPGSSVRPGGPSTSPSPSYVGGSISASPPSTSIVRLSTSAPGISGSRSTSPRAGSRTPVASSSSIGSSGRSIRPSSSSNTIHTTQSLHSQRSNTPPSAISTTNSAIVAPSSPTSPTMSTGSTHLLHPHPAISIPIPTSQQVPATGAATMPSQPYRDPRPAVKAYFTISCASATGSSQTRFSSAPDLFAVSQSWGWKSSSLRTEEYLDVNNVNAAVNSLSATGSGGSGETASIISSVAPSPITPLGGLGDGSGVNGREVSLRATVVLGLV